MYTIQRIDTNEAWHVSQTTAEKEFVQGETIKSLAGVVCGQAISSGLVHTGISADQVDQDVDTLIDGAVASEAQMISICRQIQEVRDALEGLQHQISHMLPHHHNLPLPITGNRLLQMLADIMCSQWEFSGGIDVVRKRIMANLRRREKSREAVAMEAYEKSTMHKQEALL
ncbi:hypothetical protein Q4595_16785, partial [Wenyingzhuangia sp. 1_MG-2023]|nr:hypothetical protein [Wenyingzhuangia sp. 1_MG-2023]